MGWSRERGEASLSDVNRTIRLRPRTSAFPPRARLCRPRLSRRCRLYGPRQLGHLARRRRAVRLHAARRRAPLQYHGDHPAGALRRASRSAPAAIWRRPAATPFPGPVAWALWLFAEIAIIATDIAEVVGTAIGLNLLFGIPLEIGVLITALDVFLILWLQKLGLPLDRGLHHFGLLGVIFACFLRPDRLADPEWGEVIKGFAPTTEIVNNPTMLYLALGIIGATVMPHNLYLHSGIVQTRDYGDTPAGKARGAEIRHHRFDRGADVRAARQRLDPDPRRRNLPQDRHRRVLPRSARPTPCSRRCWVRCSRQSSSPSRCSCCGLNSTVTATMAGQIVMEGFLNFRLPAWARRLFTRMVAIVPAAAVTHRITAQEGTGALLILSQVILAFQLPFAIVPLVMFTRDKAKMGALLPPSGSRFCCGGHRRHHHRAEHEAPVGYRPEPFGLE